MILRNANIDAFLAICEHGSVSAAALKLNLSQAGATQRIQSLEGELGVSLFTRGRRGMRLTVEGEFLLRYCHEARGLEGRLLADLKKAGTDQPVDFTIATNAALVAGRFAEACAPVCKQWPNLNLRFLIDVNANRLALLKRGTADLAVVLKHEVTAELDSKIIKSHDYFLAGPAAWKGRDLADIVQTERLFAYHPGDSLGLDYLKAHGLLKRIGRPRLYVNDNQSLEKLIELGVGYGLVPRELVADRLHRKTLIPLHGDRVWSIEMALAWYPRETLPPYFQAVVKALK